MDIDVEGERTLLAAVLLQAVCDALSGNPADDPESAKRFLNPTNPLFCEYCYLLDIEPGYFASKAVKMIKRKEAALDEQIGNRNAVHKMQISLHRSREYSTQLPW